MYLPRGTCISIIEQHLQSCHSELSSFERHRLRGDRCLFLSLLYLLLPILFPLTPKWAVFFLLLFKEFCLRYWADSSLQAFQFHRSAFLLTGMILVKTRKKVQTCSWVSQLGSKRNVKFLAILNILELGWKDALRGPVNLHQKEINR